MTFFLALLLVAAMLAVLFVLIKGLVNMAQTTSQDLEGEGPLVRGDRRRARSGGDHPVPPVEADGR